MGSYAMHRHFQRNFLPDTIGLQPEDEREYYANLARQPIDTSNAIVLARLFMDFDKSRDICVNLVHGDIIVNHDLVYPKDKCKLPDDHPLMKEVWENAESFHIVVKHTCDDGETHITARDQKIYIGEECVFPNSIDLT